MQWRRINQTNHKGTGMKYPHSFSLKTKQIIVNHLSIVVLRLYVFFVGLHAEIRHTNSHANVLCFDTGATFLGLGLGSSCWAHRPSPLPMLRRRNQQISQSKRKAETTRNNQTESRAKDKVFFFCFLVESSNIGRWEREAILFFSWCGFLSECKTFFK